MRCAPSSGQRVHVGEKAPAHHPAAISAAKFCCIQEIGEVRRWGAVGGVGGVGLGPAAESGLESQLPLCLPGSRRPPPCTC